MCIRSHDILISGIEGFMVVGGWNRGVPLYTEVSSFQGVGIEEFTEVSSFQGVGIEGAPLYTEVSSFQEVGIEEFHCIQRCPHFSGFK